LRTYIVWWITKNILWITKWFLQITKRTWRAIKQADNEICLTYSKTYKLQMKWIRKCTRWLNQMYITVFQQTLFVEIRILVAWLKSTLLLKIECKETHICMKTECLQKKSGFAWIIVMTIIFVLGGLSQRKLKFHRKSFRFLFSHPYFSIFNQKFHNV